MYKVMKTVSFFIIVIFLASGCTMKTPLQKLHYRLDPKPVSIDGSASISFDKAIYKVKENAIGHHHDGYARVRWQEYQLATKMISSEFLKIIVHEELKKTGYKIVGKLIGEENLFTDKTDKNEELSEFVLGAIINELKFNTYAPLAGNFDESYIVVEWQLYDKKSSKVIYERKTDGYVRQKRYLGEEAKKKGSEDAVASAFRKALRALINEIKFSDALKKRNMFSEMQENPFRFNTETLRFLREIRQLPFS